MGKYLDPPPHWHRCWEAYVAAVADHVDVLSKIRTVCVQIRHPIRKVNAYDFQLDALQTHGQERYI